MRKPRDLDSELKALADKAKRLKERKVRQLGELVVATEADALDVEILAGVLLVAAGTDDPARKESWRKRGSAFFQGASRKTRNRADRNAANDKTNAGEGTSL